MNFPNKEYSVIYADPPWSYRQHGTSPKSRGSGHKKFAIYQSMENGRVLRKGPAKGCKVLRLVNGRYITGVLHPKPRHHKK